VIRKNIRNQSDAIKNAICLHFLLYLQVLSYGFYSKFHTLFSSAKIVKID